MQENYGKLLKWELYKTDYAPGVGSNAGCVSIGVGRFSLHRVGFVQTLVGNS